MTQWLNMTQQCFHLFKPTTIVQSQFPISANAHVWCIVCSLETSIWKSLGTQIVDTYDWSSNQMATCSNPKCNVFAHSHVTPNNGFSVFKIPQIVGLSWFKIAHHHLAMGLFYTTSNNSSPVDIQTYSKTSRQQKTTKTLYIVCNMICWMYATIIQIKMNVAQG